MKVVRYLLFIPISIGLFLILSYIIPWILYYLWKVMYFLMIFGTRYDTTPIFGFEYDIEHFKSFLFTTGLGNVIAAAISGYVGSLILPDKFRKVLLSIAAVIFLALIVITGINVWNSVHWFYSLVGEVVLLVVFGSYCGGLMGGGEKD